MTTAGSGAGGAGAGAGGKGAGAGAGGKEGGDGAGGKGGGGVAIDSVSTSTSTSGSVPRSKRGPVGGGGVLGCGGGAGCANSGGGGETLLTPVSMTGRPTSLASITIVRATRSPSRRCPLVVEIKRRPNTGAKNGKASKHHIKPRPMFAPMPAGLKVSWLTTRKPNTSLPGLQPVNPGMIMVVMTTQPIQMANTPAVSPPRPTRTSLPNWMHQSLLRSLIRVHAFSASMSVGNAVDVKVAPMKSPIHNVPRPASTSQASIRLPTRAVGSVLVAGEIDCTSK